MNSSRRASFFGGFKYAWEGLLYVIRTQPHFRFHAFAALAVTGLALWLDVSTVAWAILLLIIGVVLLAEMFNTALETLVDLVSPDYHPLAKHVKDVAAGAVLLVAILSVLIGLLILGPPLWVRLGLS
jgi:undecaprenol kinase/diacylglycerol kinase (ATP)